MPSTSHSSALPNSILLVEDNAIIAMDTVDMLEEAGCDRVLHAADVSTAMAILDKDGPIDGAILDVNLGDSTSRPVADALAERGIPFLLTTGYGDEDLQRSGYPAAPVLIKPFTPSELVAAISRLGLSQTGDEV